MGKKHTYNSEGLLQQIQSAIRYQMRSDGNRVRLEALHFTTIGELPGMIASLR